MIEEFNQVRAMYGHMSKSLLEVAIEPKVYFRFKNFYSKQWIFMWLVVNPHNGFFPWIVVLELGVFVI